MTTTRHFRSSDAGAPVLNGTLGSLISLMKICLVGTAGIAYGSKPAAGWTKAYEDIGAYKVALRNSLAASGTGCYIRILDDGSGISGSAAIAHMSAYSAMSDIDTGADVTPAPVTGWPGKRVEKSSDVSSAPVAWELVADELTFYLTTQSNSNTKSIVYGAGDFASNVSPDQYRVFVAGGDASTSGAARGCSLTSPGLPNASTGSIAVMRDQQGSAGAASSGAYAYQVLYAFGGSKAPYSYSSDYASETHMVPLMLSSSTGVRGTLRGLYAPMQNTQGETLPKIITASERGSSLLMVRGNTSLGVTNQSYWGALLIEVANEWAR